MKSLILVALSFVSLFGFNLTGLQAQSWSEAQVLDATDPTPLSNYGVSADISGNYTIIGADLNSYDAAGGSPLSGAGAAYIRTRRLSGNWETVGKLVASDRATNDHFGYSVSIHGAWAAAGSYNKEVDTAGPASLKEVGAVYAFGITSPDTWTEFQVIDNPAPDDLDRFGRSLSIGGDFMAIGAPGEQYDAAGGSMLVDAGAVYIYERDNAGIWFYVQKIVAPDRGADDGFGEVVHTDGQSLIIGAPFEDEDVSGGATLADAGAVYVYNRNSSGTFDLVQKVVSPDRSLTDGFGSAVSIKTDYMLVGAPFEDEDITGSATMADAGAVYFFERNDTGLWGSPQKYTPADRAPGDNFGFSVSIGSSHAVASSPFNVVFTPGTAGEQSGSAYVFSRELPAAWTMDEKIFSADYSADDFFGGTVSIDETYIVVGAEDKTVDPTGSPITSAGTSFLFELCSAPIYETMSICEGDSLYLAGAWQVGSGIYLDTYSAGFGCDTIVETTLTVMDVDESVAVGAESISANLSGADYQWIDCATGLDISGATLQTFTPTASGDYAVRVDDGTCMHTSDCVAFLKTGLQTPDALGWSVYPNPFMDYIVLESAFGESVQAQITDLSGRLLYRANLLSSNNVIRLDGLASGVYFLQITLANGERAALKLVRN